MLENKDLQNMVAKARTELDACGFDTSNLDNTRFFFVRQSKTDGITKKMCNSYVVELATTYKYVETREQFDAMFNTLVHEMLHVVDGLNDRGHNGTWLELAKKWNKNHKRTWQIKQFAQPWEMKAISDLKRNTHKYTLEVHDAGKTSMYHYTKMCKMVSYALAKKGDIIIGDKRISKENYELVVNY